MMRWYAVESIKNFSIRIRESIAERQYEKELERCMNHGYTLAEIEAQENAMWAIHGPNSGS